MIKNIIFTGGGLRGWAYIGTLQALEEYNIKNLNQVIGVSVGSMFGLCYILGIKWEYLLDYFINLNFKELFDIEIDDILTNQSLFKGIKFIEMLRELIGTKIDPDITIEELKIFSGILFTVNALNINDSKLEYFNYNLTPTVKVIDAIRASCSLPFVLPPYEINGKYYYDGGIGNNCPTQLIDEVDSIAFDVAYWSAENNSKYKLVDLLNCLVSMNNKSDGNCNSQIMYTILNDERFNKESVNLNQSKDDIFTMYMHGYLTSKEIIFKNYIALPST